MKESCRWHPSCPRERGGGPRRSETAARCPTPWRAMATRLTCVHRTKERGVQDQKGAMKEEETHQVLWPPASALRPPTSAPSSPPTHRSHPQERWPKTNGKRHPREGAPVPPDDRHRAPRRHGASHHFGEADLAARRERRHWRHLVCHRGKTSKRHDRGNSRGTWNGRGRE